jgi:hypothetical protein
MYGTLEKSTNDNEGKASRNRNSDTAFGTNFRIRNCSQRSKQKLDNNFSLLQGGPKNLKTISECTKSTDLI